MTRHRYTIQPAGDGRRYVVWDTYTSLPQTRPTTYSDAVAQRAALERLAA